MNEATAAQLAPSRTITREEFLAALPKWRWYYGSDFRRWVEKTPGTPAELWAKSERGDHLLFLAAWAGIDRRQLVGAACAVARQAFPFVRAGEDRPRIALETAEAWARREPGVTLLQVRTADAAAAAAAADAAAADAAAATAAADAAAAAAAAAAADAADDAAAAAAAAAWTSTRQASIKKSAELVRSLISWDDIQAALLQ
jgi:chemosensory pili system protein ChpA (sensor histidine kinase/response regulator)